MPPEKKIFVANQSYDWVVAYPIHGVPSDVFMCGPTGRVTHVPSGRLHASYDSYEEACKITRKYWKSLTDSQKKALLEADEENVWGLYFRTFNLKKPEARC